MIQVKTNCFIGIEAEGPFRGKKTLFIPGSFPGEKLTAILEKYKSQVERVYYGAGNDREINQETVKEILKYFLGNLLTIECELIPKWTRKFTLDICIVTFDYESYDCDWFKIIIPPKIKWLSYEGKEIVTYINDPLFSQDVDILE